MAVCRTHGLRGVCGALNLGGLPSLAEQQAWRDAQARTDGEGYRAYLRAYPGGEFATQAHSRLVACRPEAVERWEPRSQMLPIFVARETKPIASAAQAREDALCRVKDAAELACQPLRSSTVQRLLGSHPLSEGLACEEGAGGWYCNFDGQARCELEERTTSAREICN